MTGSEVESEAPAESGVEDDAVPAPKGHVEFSSSVVVDVPRDTPPNVKVMWYFQIHLILLNYQYYVCVFVSVYIRYYKYV